MVVGTGQMAQRVWPLMVSVVALHCYSTLVAATPQGATSSSIHHSVFSNRWQKMIRRRRVLACICNEFPYQFLNNKFRFSDMMPFKSRAGCETYLHVEFKQDWSKFAGDWAGDALIQVAKDWKSSFPSWVPGTDPCKTPWERVTCDATGTSIIGL